MKKPAELVRLVETLDDSFDPDDELVESLESGRAVVRYPNGETLTLDSFDCERLFQSEDSASAFAKAVGKTSELSLELQGVRVPTGVFDRLSELFSECDEV